MTTKRRSPSQTATSFSVEKDLLKQIDERAEDLGLNRSQYLARLAQNDIAKGGPLVLTSKSQSSGIRYPEHQDHVMHTEDAAPKSKGKKKSDGAAELHDVTYTPGTPKIPKIPFPKGGKG